MKRLIMTGTVLAAAVSLAMPTKKDFKVAEPIVAELMAPTVADYKAKKKTAAEVGEISVRFAQKAETEAAKFLLYRGAVNFLTRGEEYDKAVDAALALQTAIPDIPAEDLAEVVSRATVRATDKKAPRLFALYRKLKTQAAASADAKRYAKMLKKSPDDLPTRRKYAEALAAAGSWKASLTEFAKLKDNAAKFAKAELDGTAKAYEAGEYWWTYEPTYDKADETFKAHAAAFYRQALAAGAITGLRVELVKRRIEPYADEPSTVLQDQIDQKTIVVAPTSNVSGTQKAVKLKTMTLDLGKGVDMEFVECPAGSFIMGNPGDKDERSIFREHKVNITRPFYMSKYPVTMEQLCVFCNQELGSVDKIIGPKQIVVSAPEEREAIFKALNQRFRSKVPRGYLFRLPTEAEYAYAMNADTTDPNDCYYRTNIFRDYWKRMVTARELKEMIKKAGGTFDESNRVCVESKDGGKTRKFPAVGQRRLNRWGLGDFTDCLMLDGSSLNGQWSSGSGKNLQDVIQYAAEETDPLRMGANSIRWTEFGYYFYKLIVKAAQRIPFRIVIGPDLVSEWKAKHAKK